MNKLSRQDRREWLIFTIILLIGMFMLQFVANIAVAAPPSWQVKSNMDSNINPEKNYNIRLNTGIEALLPEIITPPAWEMSSLLTVEPYEYKNLSVVSLNNFFQTPTPTIMMDWQVIKNEISGNSTPTSTSQVNNPVAKIEPTILPTEQPSNTIVSPTKTTVATNISAQGASPTPTATNIFQQPTPTNTSAPQINPTNTPTSTLIVAGNNGQPPSPPVPTTASKPTKAPKPVKAPKPTKSIPPGKNN